MTQLPDTNSCRAFVVWQQHSDRSNEPEFIYIGCDKVAAFDALEMFLFEASCEASSIYIDYAREDVKP